MNASINFSQSINARQVGDIIAKYTTEVRTEVGNKMAEFEKAFRDMYKAKSNPHIIGGEANYFYEWFEKDDTGNINKNFRVKSPNDPIFANKPTEKRALETFLKILEDYKYGESTLAIQEAKENGTYYDVPLMPAKTLRQLRGDKLSNFFSNQYEEYKNLVEKISFDQIEQKQAYEKENTRLFNRFNLDEVSRDN